MPTSLYEDAPPSVGESLVPFEGTAGGLTSLIITRNRTVRIADLSTYIKQIVGAGSPTVDPFYNAANSQTPAYLVRQRVYRKGANKVDAILSQTFAQVPASYDDYQDLDFLFPAFTGVNTAGMDGVPASRSSPLYKTVPARVSHEFFFQADARTIARPALFEPTDASNNRTNYLTGTTNPTGDEYEYYCASGVEIVTRVSVRRWMGDIWERLTYRVFAA
jgi:hypothetical protein